MTYLIKLSFKYLKRQKLRTFLTFMCIVLAAFGISLFAVYASTYYNSMMNITKKTNGSYEVGFRNLVNDDEKIDIFLNHSLVDKGYYHNMEYASLDNEFVDENTAYSIYDVICDGEIVYSDDVIRQQYIIGEDEIVPSGDEAEISDSNGEVLFSSSGMKKNNYLKSGSAPVNKGEGAIPEDFEKAGYKIGDTIRITLNTNSGHMNYNSPEVEAIKAHIDDINKKRDGDKRREYWYIFDFGEPDFGEPDFEENTRWYGMSLLSAFGIYGPVLFENCTHSNYYEYVPFLNKQTKNTQTIAVKITGFTNNKLYKFASLSDGFNMTKAINGVDTAKTEKFDTAFATIDKDTDFNEAVEQLYVDIGYNKDDFLIDNTEKIFYNTVLLALEFRDYNSIASFVMLYAFLIVVALIVWLICRFSVDNAFEISVQERVVHFNTMRTLGASKKQIAVVVLAEAVFYSLFAVPIGVGLAILVCKLSVKYLVSSGIENSLFMSASKGELISSYINPWFIFAAVMLTLIAIFISAYTSAMWAGRNSTLNEALSYGKPKALSLKARKKTKLRRKKHFIFSYTVQNIKRTKKRFLISVVTMSLGVIMFAFTSVISANLVYEFMLYGDFGKSDICLLIGDYDDASQLDVFYDDEFSDSAYTSVYVSHNNTIDAEGFESFFNKISDSNYSYIKKDGSINFGSLIFIDENTYNEFIKPVYKKSYNAFKEEKKGILSISESSEKEKKFYAAGESSLPKAIITKVGNSDKKYEYEIAGAMCAKIDGNLALGALHLPIELYEELGDDFDEAKTAEINIHLNENEDSYNKLYEVINEYNERNGTDACYIMKDNYLVNHRLDALLKGIIIMVTSFIFTMWFIGIVNMINTINTGVFNRRKELAMLKAVGTSSKMINKSIYLESMMFAFTSTLIGLVIADLIVYAFLLSEMFSGGIISVLIIVSVNVVTILINVIIALLAAKPSLHTIKKKNVNNLLNNIE